MYTSSVRDLVGKKENQICLFAAAAAARWTTLFIMHHMVDKNLQGGNKYESGDMDVCSFSYILALHNWKYETFYYT